MLDKAEEEGLAIKAGHHGIDMERWPEDLAGTALANAGSNRATATE